MKTIVLTGGIGSGKTTVRNIIAQLGYFVLDADIIAKQLLSRPEIATQLKELFGKHIYSDENIINSSLIRKIIYNDPLIKKKLEDILHPAIEEEFNKILKNISIYATDVWIFYEAALILEIGRQSSFDICVVITAPEELRRERVQNSRLLAENELNKIMVSQMPDAQKLQYADYVIENSGDLNELTDKVFSLLRFLYPKGKECLEEMI